MARLYANENFPQPVVDALIKLGYDVLSTLSAGNAGKAIPDDEVLAFFGTKGFADIKPAALSAAREAGFGASRRDRLHVRPGLRPAGPRDR